MYTSVWCFLALGGKVTGERGSSQNMFRGGFSKGCLIRSPTTQQLMNQRPLHRQRWPRDQNTTQLTHARSTRGGLRWSRRKSMKIPGRHFLPRQAAKPPFYSPSTWPSRRVGPPPYGKVDSRDYAPWIREWTLVMMGKRSSSRGRWNLWNTPEQLCKPLGNMVGI